MLTEEQHASGVADKVAEHEDAAHEKRNWVRLTFDCNNRCIFCLDSDTHDGEFRDREDVKKQILDGRRKGAERLILSGGEPTIHPNYVDFIKLGKKAGYRKIQTVTNGRLFSYPEFLQKCLDAGLSEITFSIHGPNAKIHDALVGVKGAYDQEIIGLKLALEDGRPIVNIDVVINRGNVRHLPDMLRQYMAMGVREFDLLQVVPFGRAFTEGRDTLFYDLDEYRPQLQEALAISKEPGVHLWMNRFPPQHLEGYEQLIQDPYKLNDEVRGRKEEFARQLDEGIALECRDPSRCRYCYLEQLCDTLEETQSTQQNARFSVLRFDTAWEAKQPPVFGGDPASARRAHTHEPPPETTARRHLPIAQPKTIQRRSLEELTALATPSTLQLIAPNIAEAKTILARFGNLAALDLSLENYDGIAEAIDAQGRIDGKTLLRVRARNTAQAKALLALPCSAEVLVDLTRETEPWLRSLGTNVPARLALRQPNWERLTEARDNDVALQSFFRDFTAKIPVENVPACILGRTPRTAPPTFDASMATPDGHLEIFRYTRRYLLDHYYTQSLRCRSCVHASECEGVHINFVRAHGYQQLQPIVAG